MKEMPTEDSLFGKGRIREDGRKLHPMYLLQVKAPNESGDKWDVFKVVGGCRRKRHFDPRRMAAAH